MKPPTEVDRRVTAIPDFACYLPQQEEPPPPKDPIARFRRAAHAWLTRKRPPEDS